MTRLLRHKLLDQTCCWWLPQANYWIGLWLPRRNLRPENLENKDQPVHTGKWKISYPRPWTWCRSGSEWAGNWLSSGGCATSQFAVGKNTGKEGEERFCLGCSKTTVFFWFFFFFNYYNIGILVILTLKTTSFWVFRPLSQLHLTGRAIL